MSENAGIFTNQKRLVLGFDAGCVTCSELARKVEARTEGKVEVRPLGDPPVRHWREQALGGNPPWVPTLIEIDSGEVKAWTGLRMSIALGRRLGPVISWRVLQALGEVKSARKEIERPLRAGIARGITRGQFLKSVGGTAVAAAALSGGLAAATGPSAAAAQPVAAPTSEQLRVQREFMERSRQTPVGKTFTLVNENGDKITFKRTSRDTLEALNLPTTRVASPPEGERATKSSACVTAVVAGLLAIGSAALGVAALAGTSLFVAGVLITPQILGALAAAMGAGAALEGYVALYIC